jgi:hypothetical protein
LPAKLILAFHQRWRGGLKGYVRRFYQLVVPHRRVSSPAFHLIHRRCCQLSSFAGLAGIRWISWTSCYTLCQLVHYVESWDRRWVRCTRAVTHFVLYQQSQHFHLIHQRWKGGTAVPRSGKRVGKEAGTPLPALVPFSPSYPPGPPLPAKLGQVDQVERWNGFALPPLGCTHFPPMVDSE